MPIEPPPTPWVLPEASAAPEGAEFIAVGADLAAGTLLAGYRAGLFPMPEPGILGWWSPDPRGILRPGQIHVGRSLRRAVGRFEVSIDTCFGDVVAACADPDRPHGWISAQYRQAYRELHALGWAHSLEVWAADGSLAGGLFGVEIGGLFAAESKFHVATDASKVAVVALAEALAAPGDADRLIDVQWRTEHLAQFGVQEVSRPEYLALLNRAVRLHPVLGAVTRQAGATGPPTRIRWRST